MPEKKRERWKEKDGESSGSWKGDVGCREVTQAQGTKDMRVHAQVIKIKKLN